MEAAWTRIPVPIPDERDRRELAAILTACGLEVRVVRLRLTPKSTPKRFLEYRDTGLAEARILHADT